jgi:hypothetical protein
MMLVHPRSEFAAKLGLVLLLHSLHRTFPEGT